MKLFVLILTASMMLSTFIESFKTTLPEQVDSSLITEESQVTTSTINGSISEETISVEDILTQPIPDENVEIAESTTQVQDESTNNSSLLTVNNLGDSTLKVYNSDYVIPEELSTKISNIISKYDKLDIGVYAISLKDYTCIGYNESQSIFTASAVKGPYALYVVKEIANGNHNFDEELTYTKEFLNTGSGDIKYYEYGSKFTVKELLIKMINRSDNVAFLMLQDHFGYEGYNEMIKQLGCNTWLNGYTKWGNFTAEELAILWNEIYNFSKVSDEGAFLLDLLIKAEYNFIKTELGRYSKVAHKSGFNPDAYNDGAIIFAESDLNPELGTPNDYILAIMTSPGNSGYNHYCLKALSIAIDDIMRDLALYQNGQDLAL